VDILNLAWADSMLVTFPHIEKPVRHVQGFIQVITWEMELSKYQSLLRIYSNFQLLDLLGSSKNEQSANCEEQDNLRGDEFWKVQVSKHSVKRACFVVRISHVYITPI